MTDQSTARSPTTRAFRYVLTLSSIGSAAVSLGAVLHNLVDIAFHYTQGTDSQVTFAASTLVVALPISIGLFVWLRRAEAGEPAAELDRGSRLAVQVTLVVAFVWGLSRLVRYMYSVLNAGVGERFQGSNIVSPLGNLMHTGITLVLTGAVFAYWRAAPRRPAGWRRTLPLTGLLAAGCSVAVVGQVMLAGPIVADRALTSQISYAVWRISGHTRNTGSVPANLDGLNVDTTRIRYTATGPKAFTICATFATVSADKHGKSEPPAGNVDATLHPAGEVCFRGMPNLLLPPVPSAETATRAPAPSGT